MISYEALLGDFESTFGQLLEFLEIPGVETPDQGLEPLRAQSDAINEEWVRRYRLGAAE